MKCYNEKDFKMNQGYNEQIRALQQAVDELKATILDNDYHLVVQMLTDLQLYYLNHFESHYYDCPEVTRRIGILVELINAILNYGKMETNLVIEKLGQSPIEKPLLNNINWN